MKNKHISFLPNKVKKKINCLDLTFGFGGYHFYKNNDKTIAIDVKIYSVFLSRKKYIKDFFIFKLSIKNIFFLLKRFNFVKFNLLIYDQGFNSCEIKNSYYYLKKNKYKIKKEKLNKNLFFIFNYIINKMKKNFLIIFNTFNIYEYKKIKFFIKKIKFKFKLLKMNKFEISLNNCIKNSKMFIIYV